MTVRNRSLPVKLMLLILIIVSAGAQPAADTNITTLIEKVGGELLWDPVLQRGIVNRGRTSVVFQVDLPYLLQDFTRLRDIDPPRRREDGRVMLTSSAERKFLELFAADHPAEGFRISTIIIDPGHGGKDPGAVGTHVFSAENKLVLHEKDVVLRVSRMLHNRLEQEFPHKNILLTREDDRYLTLEERTRFANAIELGEQEAMIFVSIHANASLNRRSTGFEVWYLPPEYRREIIDPEDLEDDKRTIAPIINSILEEEFTVESILLARDVLAGMGSTIGDTSDNRGLKEESWFVVRNAKMPSVLVEIGFVTNPEEAKLLNDSNHLQKISDGIYNGLSGYIRKFEEGGD